MNRKFSTAGSALIAWAMALALVVLVSAPALAHHKTDHEGGPPAGSEQQGGGNGSDHDGDADSDGATTHTEDNDTNDSSLNDVPDEGDNAHPSGKDRSVEHGNSSANPNQGKSESDPDDDGRGPDRSNGGPDKPNGSGGVDLADQDGNNGCGNDDDFEDDNEGWCGKKPRDSVAPETITLPCDIDAAMPGIQPCETGVLGDTIDNPDEPNVLIDESVPEDESGPDEVLNFVLEAQPEDQVLGETITAPDQTLGAVLPFTGSGIAGFVVAGLVLLVLGTFLMRRKVTS